MNKYIPGKPEIYLTERAFRRKQERTMIKLEKKYGKNLPIPTEEDVMNYINEKLGTNNSFNNINNG